MKITFLAILTSWRLIPILLFTSNFLVAATISDEITTAKTILETAKIKNGLCVHLGASDGKLTAAIAQQGNFLVHGIALDETSLEKTRLYLQAQGIYGQASVELVSSLRRLSYADNIVNLLIIEDMSKLLKLGLTIQEAMRAVCPNGAIMIKQGIGAGGTENSESEIKAKLGAIGIKEIEWIKQSALWFGIKKLYPAEMGEWTHNIQANADGNAVSKDKKVGAATSLRWLAGPIWPIGGHRKGGNKGIVSAHGRNFYLTSHVASNFKIDTTLREDVIYLVARDAFNGLLLWEQPATDGALIAVGEQVYAVLKKDGALVALNAATGEIIMTYKDIISHKVIWHKGNLLAQVSGGLQSFEAQTGKLRWKYSGHIGKFIAGSECVFCEVNNGICCLNANTGQEMWKKTASGKLLSYHEDFLAFIHRENNNQKTELVVHSAKDGARLWTYEYRHANVRGEESVFMQKGLIWLCQATDIPAPPNPFTASTIPGLIQWTGLGHL